MERFEPVKPIHALGEDARSKGLERDRYSGGRPRSTWLKSPVVRSKIFSILKPSSWTTAVCVIGWISSPRTSTIGCPYDTTRSNGPTSWKRNCRNRVKVTTSMIRKNLCGLELKGSMQKMPGRKCLLHERGGSSLISD